MEATSGNQIVIALIASANLIAAMLSARIAAKTSNKVDANTRLTSTAASEASAAASHTDGVLSALVDVSRENEVLKRKLRAARKKLRGDPPPPPPVG